MLGEGHYLGRLEVLDTIGLKNKTIILTLMYVKMTLFGVAILENNWVLDGNILPLKIDLSKEYNIF